MNELALIQDAQHGSLDAFNMLILLPLAELRVHDAVSPLISRPAVRTRTDSPKAEADCF